MSEKAPHTIKRTENRQAETAVKIARNIIIEQLERQPVPANLSAAKKAIKPVITQQRLAKIRKPVNSTLTSKMPRAIAMVAKQPSHKPERAVTTELNSPPIAILAADINPAEHFPKSEIGAISDEAIIPLALQPESSAAEVSFSKAHAPDMVTADKLEAMEAPDDYVFSPLEVEDNAAIMIDQVSPETNYETINSELVDEAIREILGNEPIPAEVVPETENMFDETEAGPVYVSELDHTPTDLNENQEGQTTQIKDQFSDYFEVLDHEEIEPAVEMVYEIIDIAQRLQKESLINASAVSDEIRTEEITEELKEACIALLVKLDIKPDLEKLEIFLLAMQSSEFSKERILLQQILEEGTHEQKNDDSHMLNLLFNLILQDRSLNNLLGRLALNLRSKFSPELLDARLEF